MVEGKDEPEERPTEQYPERGKDVSFMFRLTKNTHGTWNIVVLDSGEYKEEGSIWGCSCQ